jgi:hypothetical protein
MKISLSTEFIILISGIFLGIFGLCVPHDILSLTLVVWSIAFLIIAPVYAILKPKEKIEAKMPLHNAILCR